MKAYVSKIFYVAAALALLMGLVPAVAYAADATGSFGCNNAAPTITSVTLQQADKVAYIRFASDYKSFQDVGDFSDAIDAVKNTRRRQNDKK